MEKENIEMQINKSLMGFMEKNNREHEDIRLKHAELKKDVGAIHATTNRIEKKLDKFIDGADKKFAPLISWQVLKWAGAVTGALVLGAVVSQVIIK